MVVYQWVLTLQSVLFGPLNNRTGITPTADCCAIDELGLIVSKLEVRESRAGSLKLLSTPGGNVRDRFRIANLGQLK